jgi:hypothetical protein
MSRRFPNKPYHEGQETVSLKKKHYLAPDLLSAIDESPEFDDPYSELNLFLSQKIKKEIRHCSHPNKWSVQLQEELLHKISPEFQKKFPKYRLGTTALKKTWEKVHYFTTQIQEQKEALNQDGKLNLSYFIKENLKTANQLQRCHIHPCHWAHQLAMKMSECIAVVDGIRPRIDQLTRTIWSLQRHLIPKLPPEHFKSPYDENEKIDKLIVKAILQMGAKHPDLTQAELAFHTRKYLEQLKNLTDTYCLAKIKKMLIALFADSCDFTNQRMEKTLENIPYPIAKLLKEEGAFLFIDHPRYGIEQLTEQTFAFFEKAKGALEAISEEEIEQKIQNWTLQSDMLLRWIRLPDTLPLLHEIQENFTKGGTFEEIVRRACHHYFNKYPKMLHYGKEVQVRAWSYLKSYWYTHAFHEETPTYERFLLWQKKLLSKEKLSPQQLLERVEKKCKRALPLLPFNRARAQTLLVMEEQNDTY